MRLLRRRSEEATAERGAVKMLRIGIEEEPEQEGRRGETKRSGDGWTVRSFSTIKPTGKQSKLTSGNRCKMDLGVWLQLVQRRSVKFASLEEHVCSAEIPTRSGQRCDRRVQLPAAAQGAHGRPARRQRKRRKEESGEA